MPASKPEARRLMDTGFVLTVLTEIAVFYFILLHLVFSCNVVETASCVGFSGFSCENALRAKGVQISPPRPFLFACSQPDDGICSCNIEAGASCRG
jgi:hypothetical protein